MSKKIIFLFIILFNVDLSSNSLPKTDSLLNRNIDFNLEYYHDISEKETIQSIQEKEFYSYNNKTFPWVQGQKFWFKLKPHQFINDKKKYFFLINTVSINNIVMYKNDGTSFKKEYVFKKNGKKKIEIPFNLLNNVNFLFEVNFGKSIYFPITIKTEQSLNKLNKVNLVIYGLYYGFVVFVLLINFFFYRQTKEHFFLYYILLAISIALILFELDGLVFFTFGTLSCIDVVLHTLLLISFFLFTNVALQLNKSTPKLKFYGIALIVLNIIPFIMYVINDSIFWYSIGEFFNLIGILTYWFVSLWYFKRMVFARFIFIAYSVIIISSIAYVLPSEFGMKDLGFTPTFFKIGSVIEMIIFLYAISYRHKSLNKVNEVFKKELEHYKNEELMRLKNSKNNMHENLENFIQQFSLTDRESEVLKYILIGKSNKIIANELFLTEATIKYHCSKLYTKTNVKNRSQLAILFNSI